MAVSDQLLYPALRLCGILGAAGRTASTSQMSDAFTALNRLLDSWRTQRLLVYTVQGARYTLTPSQTSYTIGPVGADFTAPRPVRITDASIVLAGSSEVHVPLRILTDHEWARKRLREVPTTVPTELYCDGAYPISTLYLWGYPTAGNDLELFTWSQLSTFATQDDTVSFPPGYEDALAHNLAMRLCAIFRTEPTPILIQTAKETRAWVKGLQATAPRIATADYGTRGSRLSGFFNYLTGGPR